jgi:hypothetical protein
MPAQHTFHVVLVDANHGIGGGETAPPSLTVLYVGQKLTVKP